MIQMNTNAQTPQVEINNTAAQSASQTAGKQDNDTKVESQSDSFMRKNSGFSAPTPQGRNGEVNQAAIESRVETQVESTAKTEVRREQAGRSAAEEMAKQNAIREQPEDGIRLEISNRGLDRVQSSSDTQGLGADNQSQTGTQTGANQTQASTIQGQNSGAGAVGQTDEASATEQRIEEQQKVREKIREQVEQEVDDEEQEVRQTNRRDDENERRAAQSRRNQDDEATNQVITNYAGYTNAQLQQMYQQGVISRNDYEAEIENREEKVEQTQQSLSNTDRELAQDINRGERVQRQVNATETAFSDDSNTNVNARTRDEILQNLENPQDNRANQQNAQREQQMRAFSQWQNDFGFLIR